MKAHTDPAQQRICALQRLSNSCAFEFRCQSRACKAHGCQERQSSRDRELGHGVSVSIPFLSRSNSNSSQQDRENTRKKHAENSPPGSAAEQKRHRTDSRQGTAGLAAPYCIDRDFDVAFLGEVGPLSASCSSPTEQETRHLSARMGLQLSENCLKTKIENACIPVNRRARKMEWRKRRGSKPFYWSRRITLQRVSICHQSHLGRTLKRPTRSNAL